MIKITEFRTRNSVFSSLGIKPIGTQLNSVPAAVLADAL